MAITISEAWATRVFSPRSAERSYHCHTTGDDVPLDHGVIYAQVLSTVPTSANGVPRLDDQIEIREIADDRALIRVPYGDGTITQNQPPQVGTSEFSFEIAGGQARVFQSLQTVNTYAAPSMTAPDFKGAINVGRDNRVQGTDIIVPVFSWGHTAYLEASEVDDTYLGVLSNLVGKTNNATFRFTNANETFLLGAAGVLRSDLEPADPMDPQGGWDLRYAFLSAPNKTGLTVGDITAIAKKAWDYLWVLYDEVEDSTAKFITQRPRAAYVERVYDEGDFSTLKGF